MCPIRILGFLILYAAKYRVWLYLAKSVFSCNDNLEILVNLGLFFKQYIIFPSEFLNSGLSSIYGELCPVRKYRGQTPGPYTHLLRLSFEKYWENMKAKITEAPKNHKNAKSYQYIVYYTNGFSSLLLHRPSFETTGDIL